MKGVIWCTNLSDGNKMLEKIIDNYEFYGIDMEINGYKHSKLNGSSVTFNNGDNWRVCKANEYSRGVRCNIAYIQKNIPYNIYRTIILPTIFDYPFSGIHLWGEGNLHISNEIQRPF